MREGERVVGSFTIYIMHFSVEYFFTDLILVCKSSKKE